MTEETIKPKMHLIIQANIPLEEIIEGEEIYKQLKEIFSNLSEDSKVSGQIIKILESCCGKVIS